MTTLGFDKYVEPLKLYLAKYRESVKGDKPEKKSQAANKPKDSLFSLTSTSTTHSKQQQQQGFGLPSLAEPKYNDKMFANPTLEPPTKMYKPSSYLMTGKIGANTPHISSSSSGVGNGVGNGSGGSIFGNSGGGNGNAIPRAGESSSGI